LKNTQNKNNKDDKNGSSNIMETSEQPFFLGKSLELKAEKKRSFQKAETSFFLK